MPSAAVTSILRMPMFWVVVSGSWPGADRDTVAWYRLGSRSSHRAGASTVRVREQGVFSPGASVTGTEARAFSWPWKERVTSSTASWGWEVVFWAWASTSTWALSRSTTGVVRNKSRGSM